MTVRHISYKHRATICYTSFDDRTRNCMITPMRATIECSIHIRLNHVTDRACSHTCTCMSRPMRHNICVHMMQNKCKPVAHVCILALVGRSRGGASANLDQPKIQNKNWKLQVPRYIRGTCIANAGTSIYSRYLQCSIFSGLFCVCFAPQNYQIYGTNWPLACPMPFFLLNCPLFHPLHPLHLLPPHSQK